MTAEEPTSRLTKLPLFEENTVAARSLAGPNPGATHAGTTTSLFPLAPRPPHAAPEHGAAPTQGSVPKPILTSAPPSPSAIPGPEVSQDFEAANLTEAPSEEDGPGEEATTTPDWALVLTTRDAVTARWIKDNPNRVLNRDRDLRRLEDLIDDQLLEHNKRAAAEGTTPLTFSTRGALKRAVLAGIFGAGRFQRFLDTPDIENIEIEGFDNIHLQKTDGSVARVPSPWTSDDELVADLQHLARTCVSGERQFSVTHKYLRMPLPDGSRLAAEGWVTPQPSITIRRHGFIDTDLEESVRLGLIDSGIAQFERTAFRAGKTFVIVGDPAAGKTTHARALLNCLDPRERIATIESMYELGMHRLPERHHRVWAAEAQEGGEIGPDGRPLGGIDLTQLVRLALQKNVQRLIIGEITGPEVLAMLNAMQGGRGSLSTMHASSAIDAVDRMVNLILQASSNTNLDFAYRLVALNVDYIVHIAYVNEGPIGGSSHRFVDEIVELLPSRDRAIPFIVEPLWKPGPDGRAVPTGTEPTAMVELARWGLRREVFRAGNSTWDTPLELKVRGTRGGAA